MTAKANSDCEIWGVLNVTPDSFSDGGRFDSADTAMAQARRMRAEGADVIDVGGASSRPAGITYGDGAAVVSPEEEWERSGSVVAELGGDAFKVSVDTFQPEVAKRALAAGAHVINDVSGHPAPELLSAVADAGADLVIMHSKNSGRGDSVNAAYEDVVSEVLQELTHEVERAVQMGVGRDKIWIDPGIGFAKTAAQSVQLLAATQRFVATGYPVLVGASRKSFIAEMAPNTDETRPSPVARLGGSLAALVAAVYAGSKAIRVHDVFESVQAMKMTVQMMRRRDAR